MRTTGRQAELLEIRDLRVAVGDRVVLDGVDLSIAKGEVHVLLGPNGSGKTTLLSTIIGLPHCKVVGGTVTFKGIDLLTLSIDERARLGVGVAFQRPPAIRGVHLSRMLELAASRRNDPVDLDAIAGELDLSALLERDVNAGFSGGETKRAEIAQLIAQSPDLALIDEPESGVDLENIAVVGSAIQRLLRGDKATDAPRAGLIITHTGHILEHVSADVGHVLLNGRIACSGNPRDLVADVAAKGFERCVECLTCTP